MKEWEFKPGNKEAEKWTQENVLEKLQEIDQLSKEDKNVVFLYEALELVDLYPDVWQYWKEKFKEDIDVFRAIKKIEQMLENRICKKGLTGEHNATMSIFLLKAKYGYSDKQEINLNVTKGADSIFLEEDDDE